MIPYEEWDFCQCKEHRIPPGALEVRYEGSPYVHLREKDGECYRDTRDNWPFSIPSTRSQK